LLFWLVNIHVFIHELLLFDYIIETFGLTLIILHMKWY